MRSGKPSQDKFARLETRNALSGILPIEIRHSASPKLDKGFVEVLDALELQLGFVIALASEPFPLSLRKRLQPSWHAIRVRNPNSRSPCPRLSLIHISEPTRPY